MAGSTEIDSNNHSPAPFVHSVYSPFVIRLRTTDQMKSDSDRARL
jgi:hypothetical protein